MTERPTDYDKNLADKLCDYISVGYSISEIIQKFKEMPEKRTITKWRTENESFFRQYMAAYQDQGQTLIDEVKNHMSQLEMGLIDAQTAKVLIDSKMKLASKLYPEMYGDKILSTNNVIEESNVMTDTDVAIFRAMGFEI